MDKLIIFEQMLDRVEKAKNDSDTTYFNDLLLYGELILKSSVSALISSLDNDKDRHRYRLAYRLVRADGIGEWAAILEELITGVASQFLQPSVRMHEQKELTQKSEKETWQYSSLYHLQKTIEILQLKHSFTSNNSKIQFKTWFNLFAALRNGTRGHGATLPHLYSECLPHLEESIKIFVSNFHLFKRSWVYLYENLSGKYRVTKLANSITDFEKLKSDTSHAGKYPNGVYIQFDTITLAELIYSNQDADDFFFPNGAFRDKRFELLSYKSGIRKEGNGSYYLTPITELPASETEGIGELELKGNCFTNMPNLYKDYVNRPRLQGDLLHVIKQEDRYPIITLVGRGGIGKTSIALKVIRDLIHESRYDMILWFSARDIDLTIDGPKVVKNKILNESDIAIEYCNLMGKKFEKKEESVKYLSQSLTKSEFGNTLFVFDNFETVSNPIELFTWIDTYIRNPNKVLITSRTSKSFKADYPIEIMGMSQEECQQLIQTTASNLGIENILTPENILNLIEESNGHPYVIKILLGTVAKNKEFKKIERIIATHDDILAALFKRTYQTLTPAAKRVFLTLCSWRSLIPQLALEAVLLSSTKERINVEEAIEDLKRNSFIEEIKSNEENVFISVPLAASVFGRSELEVSPLKIEIHSDRELLMEFGATQPSDLKGGLHPRLERKIRKLANKASSGETISAHIPIIEYISRRYARGWVLLSELYIENDDLENAINSLNEFIKSDSSEDEKKEVWQTLANYYKRKEDFLGEVNALVEKCCLSNANLFEISETANVINNYLSKDYFFESKLILDIEVKSSLIQKIADIMLKKISKGSATDYSRLAWLFLHLNDRIKAQELVEKGLLIESDNQYCLKLSTKINL